MSKFDDNMSDMLDILPTTPIVVETQPPVPVKTTEEKTSGPYCRAMRPLY